VLRLCNLSIDDVVNSITIMLLTMPTGGVVYSELSTRCGVSHLECQQVLGFRSQLVKEEYGVIP